MKMKISLKKLRGWILEIIMILVSLIYIIPLWLVLTNSLKTKIEADGLNLALPRVFQFKNYVEVFANSPAFKGLLIGIFESVTVSVVTILFASMAGFYIVRVKNWFSKFSYNYVVSGLIVPIAVIPTYFVLLMSHLNNTFLGLIMIFITYMLPFSVFMYAGFIKTIPAELDEAAIIDGCGTFRLFFNIIFPLLAPTTITVVVFVFTGVWNDAQIQLFYASGDKWSLPMTVYSFFGKYFNSWHLVFADVVITIVPCLALYIGGQKYVISGMTAGAVKG